jgi:hypothetical protein
LYSTNARSSPSRFEYAKTLSLTGAVVPDHVEQREMLAAGEEPPLLE